MEDEEVVGVGDRGTGSDAGPVGWGKANPIGTILSFALMLRIALGEEEAAAEVERAVEATLVDGVRTGDIAQGADAVSTMEMAEAVAGRIMQV